MAKTVRMTVSTVNDDGQLQCIGCDETFGAASDVARAEEISKAAGKHFLSVHAGRPDLEVKTSHQIE